MVCFKGKAFAVMPAPTAPAKAGDEEQRGRVGWVDGKAASHDWVKVMRHGPAFLSVQPPPKTRGSGRSSPEFFEDDSHLDLGERGTDDDISIGGDASVRPALCDALEKSHVAVDKASDPIAVMPAPWSRHAVPPRR